MRGTVTAPFVICAISLLGPHADTLRAASPRPRTLYVVSTAGEANKRNTLSIVDVPSWRISTTVRLRYPQPRSVAVDPVGRVWVTYSAGRDPAAQDRVQVLADSGKLLATLDSCRGPEAGIAFAAGRAFVACSEDGRSGRVNVLDATTLASIGTIQIPAPTGDAYFLTAIAASDTRVVLAGMTKGPDAGRRYAAITTLDPMRLAVTWQSKPIADLDVWSIVPYASDFLLANVASAESRDPTRRADVMRLRPGNQLDRITVTPSPLWAAVADDVLYLYHNPSWNSVSASTARALSSYHLTRHTMTQWDLPDGFDAGAIAVLGDRIALASPDTGPGRRAGVYAFDVRDRVLVDPIPLAGAEKLATGGT